MRKENEKTPPETKPPFPPAPRPTGGMQRFRAWLKFHREVLLLEQTSSVALLLDCKNRKT